MQCSVRSIEGGVYVFVNQPFAIFPLPAQQPINSAIDHFLNARVHTLAQELLCSYSSQKKLALYVPVRKPTTVKVGDLVCMKFEDLSYEAITDEEFLDNVKVAADNGQVKLTPVKREGNHFQYKVEKTTGGKIGMTLDITDSYGAFEEKTRNITVTE